MKLFMPLVKVDAVKRLVYASLATEAVDKTGEIFDYQTSKPYVEKWSGEIAKATGGRSLGNLRSMHSKVAAGKFVELTCNDEGKRVDAVAKVVDDAEWKKVEEGVYTGLSIGGSYVKKWKDGEHTRYTADPNEGSLVDLPCNPEAHFVMIKDGGAEEMRKFIQPKTETETPATETAAETTDLSQGWRAKDGSFHLKKADAEAHNEALAKAASDPAGRLESALAAATGRVAKVENTYGMADSAQDASSEVLELKDITDLPAIVRAAMADNATAEVFRVAYNKARASGMGPVEALNDVWGQIVEQTTRTIDGKYTISGELDRPAVDTSTPDVGQYGAGIKGVGLGAQAQLSAQLGRSAAPSNPSAAAPVGKRDFSQAERDKAADTGAAMPDGSYPIKSTKDLSNAIQAYGRAKNKAKVKAHIKSRAASLGATASLPDSWKDGADKALIVGDLRKDLYTVCELAYAIMGLERIQEATEYEAAREGDQSEVPKNLKQDIANLGACLRQMVEEETNELLSEDEMLDFGEMLEAAAHTKGINALVKISRSIEKNLSTRATQILAELRKAHSQTEAAHVGLAHDYIAKAGANCGNMSEAEKAAAASLTKAGARHNAADQAHLDSAHDHLDKMGYCGKGAGMDGDEEAEKAARAEALAKGMSKEDQVHLDSAHDHIAKCGIGCGMGKAGARHSAADAALLKDAHDHLTKAGANCPEGVMDGDIGKEKEEKAAPSSDLIKTLADKNATIDRLEKVANAAIVEIENLTKRVTHIESQQVPDPRQRTYRLVSKEEDDARAAQEQISKAAKEDPRTLFKALLQDALNNPIPLERIGTK